MAPDQPVEDEPPQGPVPPVLNLGRNRDFRMLWVGQVLSNVGSNASSIAYPLLVLALTHSAVIAGAVGTISALVAFVLRLPAGALSDRLDRRLTMIVCDGGRALLLALLAAIVLARAATWPLVLLVAVADEAGGVLFSPASTAALPALVAPGQLEKAWAATEARTYAASFVGPALGGALFSLGRAVPFLSDAVSYGISVGTVSRISGTFRAPPQTDGRRSLWAETLDGMRLVWKTALLRAVIIQAPLVNFAVTGAIFTVTLGLRRHGDSAAEVGLVQAGVAVGGLLGALAATPLQGRLRLSRMVIVLTTGGAVLLGLAALVAVTPLVAVPVAAALFLGPPANAALFAAVLRTTPDAMRGRVTNTGIAAAVGLAALAPVTAGTLVQRGSSAWAMAFFAVVMAVAAVLAVALPGLRAAEAEAGTGLGPAR
jgi:MFS family permease